MLDLLFSLPLWALALTLNLGLMGFALGALRVFRRGVLPRLRISAADSEYGGALVQSIMVFYGLIAALTAVSVWERYAQVTDIVSGEATAVASLWRDFGGYPAPAREPLQALLREYTETTIREAWPEQRLGRIPKGGVERMNRLQAQLFAFEPATESQKALHQETLRAYNVMIQARRLRLDAVTTRLPGVLWIVLLPGALACVLISLFFKVEDGRLQAVYSVVLSGFIAMVLFVIFALDRPFQSQMAIGPDSLELIYDQLMRK